MALADVPEDGMVSTVVGFEVLWQCWSSEMPLCHHSQRPSPVETIPAACTGMWGCPAVRLHLIPCVDLSMARPPPFQLLHSLDTWNCQLALSLATGIETTAHCSLLLFSVLRLSCCVLDSFGREFCSSDLFMSKVNS